MGQRVRITSAQLAEMIDEGTIDTVLMVFPDLQGRLLGKRTTGRFYREHVGGAEGTENCNYLIATDIDMTPVPGYRFTSYDRGYGDMRAVADETTIRIVPWVDRTAMVICDLFEVDDGSPIEVAPRQILRRQVERAAARGHLPMLGSEFEFYLFRDSYEEAHAKGYRGLQPHSPWIEDYHILQTTKDEYLIGQIRRHLEASGVPVEFSKGEAGRGQHEINLAYTQAVEMADRNTIYKNAAKEIAALNGRSISFMAKYAWDDTGSSFHVHSSLWSLDGRQARFDGGHDAGPAGSDIAAMPDEFRWWLGGLLATAADFTILWAPTINSYKRFQLGSWAPTGIGWGRDNRTLGFRTVGHGPGSRIESRIPGADANSYLAFAGTIAGGLYGLENEIEPAPPFAGNGYEASDLARIPWNIAEAIERWNRSEIAREAFGADVHHHLGNMATQEWVAFNNTVTDWELRRYFERI